VTKLFLTYRNEQAQKVAPASQRCGWIFMRKGTGIPIHPIWTDI